MTYILLVISLIWPLLHLQFARLFLSKTKEGFNLKSWKTVKFMWTGTFSAAVIFGLLSILEILGMNLGFNLWGVVFGFLYIVLIYELYIQKTRE